MPVLQDKQVRILIRYKSDVLRGETVEKLNATAVDFAKGLYRLESIPIFGPLVCSGDLIMAKLDEHEDMLTYQCTVEYAGNSTIQVMVLDESADVEEIRDLFLSMGCPSEKGKEKFFAMNIPQVVNYRTVREKLDELEEKGILAYAEPCLSDRHDREAA